MDTLREINGQPQEKVTPASSREQEVAMLVLVVFYSCCYLLGQIMLGACRAAVPRSTDADRNVSAKMTHNDLL